MMTFRLTTCAALSVIAFAAPAFQATAATPFDGVYKGGNTSLAGAGGRCPAGTQFSIVVRDGMFDWKVGGDVSPVRIGADGSFNGQSGTRFIKGNIAGNTMTASTSGTVCNYAWSLAK